MRRALEVRTSAPAVESVAELSAAGRRFGTIIALDDISLAVALGSLVGIIEDPTQLRAETRERIGFMLQNVSLDDDLTVPGRRA